jgi:hypothetical protein
MAYEPLGAGIASAGQSIAAGFQAREDRKWREKVFDEQKRQYEVSQQNAAKAANMKTSADFLQRFEELYKAGADPDALNQMLPPVLHSMQTGEPLNFDAIQKIQQAQQALQEPQQQFGSPQAQMQQGATAPELLNPAETQRQFGAQMQTDIETPFQAPKIEQRGFAPAQAPAPSVFPTLYDRVSTVANPKAVQVRALKPQEQIRLFREKPINFDASVKDGLEKGYVTPAMAGEYYEAKLLGKSDEELAGIMKRMWREQPLSEDEKARLRTGKDAQRAAALSDYTKLIETENDVLNGAANLTKNYNDALAKLELDGGKDVMSSPAAMQIHDEYIKQQEQFNKRLMKLGQIKSNYNQILKGVHGVDLEKISNLSEAQQYYNDRIKELSRRSLPAATVEQSIEQKEKAKAQAEQETIERFGVDIAKTIPPTTEPTAEERIDAEFDQLLAQNTKKTPDRNRAALAAVQELLKKYPDNETLRAAQVEITNRLRQ